jgi:hypothetical protein
MSTVEAVMVKGRSGEERPERMGEAGAEVGVVLLSDAILRRSCVFDGWEGYGWLGSGCVDGILVMSELRALIPAQIQVLPKF